MPPSPKVAFVTGANRGIGLEIVRQLADKGYLAVIGARDVDEGVKAAGKLKADGLEVAVQAFDAANETSAQAAAAEIKRLYGRCDVLVNNAAVLIDGPGGFRASLFDVQSETARATFEVNTLGPLRTIQAFVPLMRANGYGRIVNVSSTAGQLAHMGHGYPCYRMSKTALNALTRIAASELADTPIKVNACCPGWVRTDMGGAQAERSVEEGADTPVWLAMLPDDGPTGCFFKDRQKIEW